ncbi:MAG: hypothetical protein N2C14_15095, partial [Planctomycetales bacterium]
FRSFPIPAGSRFSCQHQPMIDSNMTQEIPAERLEIFLGDANSSQATVYVQAEKIPGKPGAVLSGHLRGPRSRYSQTLEATYPLRDAGQGETLLARALVPDPCFWRPDSPFLYSVQAEIRDGEELASKQERLIGVRALWSDRQGFYFHGRPWYPQVIQRDVCSPEDLASEELAFLRSADVGLLVENPDDSLCRETSEIGVILMAILRGEADEIRGNLNRLAQWPSVTAAIIKSGESPIPAAFRSHNLLLGEMISSDQKPPEPSEWANFLACRDSLTRATELSQRFQLPAVAWREPSPSESLETSAKALKSWRAELEENALEFAGFIS